MVGCPGCAADRDVQHSVHHASFAALVPERPSPAGIGHVIDQHRIESAISLLSLDSISLLLKSLTLLFSIVLKLQGAL